VLGVCIVFHVPIRLFSQGSGIRIKDNGKLKPNQSKNLRASLPKNRTSWLSLDQDLMMLESSFKQYRIKKLRPLFALDETKIEKMKITGQNRKGHQLADLNLYFHLTLSDEIDKNDLETLLDDLNRNALIEIAYANPVPEPATIDEPDLTHCPDLNDCGDGPPSGGGGGATATPDYQGIQGYLLSATQGGIDALYSWSKLGGAGNGIDVVDIENGWNFNHEDIDPAFYLDGINSPVNDHGTAVIGVIGARDSAIGVTGISYDSRVGGQGLGGTLSSRILSAANAVGPGGVIIIEVHQQSGINLTCQCNQLQCGFIAMENWQANFDAISTAVANGVHVVQAGGNGGVNLDDPQLLNRFNRNIRDSGAIIVGASRSTARTPMCWSNNGSRVDMHGWGENVVTTGYGDLFDEGANRLYTDTFSGTSSASPIVAGAVTNLLGYANTTLGVTIDPLTMRQHLIDSGTAQTAGPNIGPLPNLRDAIDSLTSGSSISEPVVNSNPLYCFGMNSMTWNAVTTATSYQVYVGNSSNFTTVTYPYHFLSVSQNTIGRVKACNSNGCSGFSNTVGLLRHNSCF
jgi:hypothetical protein